MTCIELNALRRERWYFVKWLAKIIYCKPLVASVPKGISDHMARDIGLDHNDLERLRFEWPSQSGDRPLI